MENSKNRTLSESITKITVLNRRTGDELAVITEDLITTANDDIVVKLTPKYD